MEQPVPWSLAVVKVFCFFQCVSITSAMRTRLESHTQETSLVPKIKIESKGVVAHDAVSNSKNLIK